MALSRAQVAQPAGRGPASAVPQRQASSRSAWAPQGRSRRVTHSPFKPHASFAGRPHDYRIVPSTADSRKDGQSRRQLLELVGLLALSATAPASSLAAADGSREEARQALLDAISQKQGDEKIEAALRNLAKFNPTPAPARSPALPGRWKLLWASKNAEVRKAQSRSPFPSASTQLLGAEYVGKEGRAANLVDFAGGAVEVYLSSAAEQDKDADDTILIGPPFYLELHLGSLTLPIQDTQPGGGRKSILGNEINYFKQLYLEDSGKPGDIRVSEVDNGDRNVVGSIFVHERM